MWSSLPSLGERRPPILFVLSGGLLAAQTAHSVTLNWDWSPGSGGTATDFNIKRSLVTGGPYTVIGSAGSATATSYEDVSTVGNVLLEGVTYYYVVTATGPGGESAPSNEASATIPSDTISTTLNQPPLVTGVSPASGSGLTQSFTFTFSDTAGWQSLGIVDVLINDVLDGQHACYVGYSVPGNSLSLVNDNGDAGGPFAGVMQLNSADSVSNSQCTVSGAGSAAAGDGQTLTLTLNVAFAPGFAGDKIVYLAASDTGTGNSGWQAMGAWNVPGTAPIGPSVRGLSPQRTDN